MRIATHPNPEFMEGWVGIRNSEFGIRNLPPPTPGARPESSGGWVEIRNSKFKIQNLRGVDG